MMKVLAAEMSDPQRLRRGKQYAKDGSVLDIVVDPGIVTGEVQGTRATPYVASLEVTPGDGMPLRRDVRAMCSCPDDDNWDDHACKHVIATMFAFADELLIEPELLDVWRGNERIDLDDDDSDCRRRRPSRPRSPTDTNDDLPGRRRHLQLVRDGMEQGRAERREQHARREREPFVDPIADVLAVPDGAVLPEIPRPRTRRRATSTPARARDHPARRVPPPPHRLGLTCRLRRPSS